MASPRRVSSGGSPDSCPALFVPEGAPPPHPSPERFQLSGPSVWDVLIPHPPRLSAQPHLWSPGSGRVDPWIKPRPRALCVLVLGVEIKDTVGMGLALQHPLFFFGLAIWRERATGFPVDHCYTCEQGLYIYLFKDTCSQNNTVGLYWLNLFDFVYLNQNYYLLHCKMAGCQISSLNTLLLWPFLWLAIKTHLRPVMKYHFHFISS